MTSIIRTRLISLAPPDGCLTIFLFFREGIKVGHLELTPNGDNSPTARFSELFNTLLPFSTLYAITGENIIGFLAFDLLNVESPLFLFVMNWRTQHRTIVHTAIPYVRLPLLSCIDLYLSTLLSRIPRLKSAHFRRMTQYPSSLNWNLGWQTSIFTLSRNYSNSHIGMEV